jgi:UDP-3-O-[3-hydroxymyristoyl] glucosamine N-acyltransferase
VQFTVQQLATLVGGTVAGDASRIVRAARPLSEAGPDHVTFVENEKIARQLKDCTAAAVVAPLPVAEKIADFAPQRTFATVGVADSLAAFIAIMQQFHARPPLPPTGIDARAAVDRTATIGPDPSIHAFAAVGAETTIGAQCRIHGGVVIGRNCRIGDDVVLYANAVLYDDVVLGDRVIVHANAVLGADGFGYRVVEGRHVKTPQFGCVEVGDDVEIGAGATIDRGTFQATRIGEGTKIDNLVMIGHNCQIGRHNLLVSQVGIAGSSSTGDYVVMAGQVGVADHVHIGEGAQLGAQSGVPSDVPAGVRVLGTPSRPERAQKRIFLSLDKLPGLCKDVRRLKRQLGVVDEE